MLFSEWKMELKEMELKDIKKQKLYELPLIKVFELLYEIEYKYNTILNKEFNGSPKRKENILKTLENKMNEIMDILPNTFINSYDEYLDGFIMETTTAIDIIQRPWQFIFQTLYTSMLKTNDAKDMKKHIEEIIEELTGKKPSDLFYKMSLKTYLRRQFYKDIEGYKDKFKEYEDFGFVTGAFQIKDMGEKLLNIKNYPIKEQFSIINQAINLTHNVGYFMFHYEKMFDINKDDLDKLSNQDVSDWNKELKEMGVIF